MVSIVRTQEVFSDRRSLASGIASTGSAVGQVVLGQFRGSTTTRLGWRNTLLVELSFILFCVMCVIVLHVQSLYHQAGPYQTIGEDENKFSKKEVSADDSPSLLRNPFTYLLVLCVVPMMIGVTPPVFFLPGRVRIDLDMSAHQAALLVQISGLFSIPARLIVAYFGAYSLRVRFLLIVLINFVTSLSTICVFLYTKFAYLAVYAMLLGVITGKFALSSPTLRFTLYFWASLKLSLY